MATRSNETTAELLKQGGAFDLGPDKTLLWNRIYRLLAQGRPVSRARLQAGPDGVAQAEPADAVITFPLRDSDQVDVGSTTAILGTWCLHSFFFPTREQAERWADGRDDVEILTLDEGFARAREFAGAWLRYE